MTETNSKLTASGNLLDDEEDEALAALYGMKQAKKGEEEEKAES